MKMNKFKKLALIIGGAVIGLGIILALSISLIKYKIYRDSVENKSQTEIVQTL